jgi:MFS family permease
MTTSAPPVRDELFGPSRRAVTVGILLLISLIAFEAMGVGTAMPAIVAELGSVASYSWPFVAFIAPMVVGTGLGGRWCDARGPRAVLLLAPALFGVGLLVGGTAGTLAQLLVGRVLQGFGAGAQGVAVYVLIALVYSERARPAVFGLVSSAWVLPSLIGPPVSGLVTEHLSWHWVFLGLLPLVLLAVGLVFPAVRGLLAPAPGERGPARRSTVAAAFAAAAGVAGLSWAAQHSTVTGAVVAAAAVGLLVPSLRRLVPVGTFRSRPGIAAVVAGRALIGGAFFTVNAFLPLILTATHRWSLSLAGVPLIVASLGWSSAAAWQGRHPDLPRPRLLRIGFLAITVSTAGLLLVAPAWGVAWLALPFGAIGGVGMGLGFSSLSYLLLAHSTGDEVGFHSSAGQLADSLSQAALVGAGGALLALLASPATAMPILLAVLTVLALTGAVVASRTVAPRTRSAAEE